MKQFLSFILLLLLVTGYSFAQDKLPGTTTGFYSTSDGTTPTDAYSTQPPVNVNADLKRIATELDRARDNGDIMKQRELEQMQNQLTGARTESWNQKNAEMSSTIYYNQGDYNQSTVLPWNNWGSSLGTVQSGPLAGRIFAASTQWNGSGGDTMTMLQSTNGGVTWTRLWSTYFISNTDYLSNECDLEVVYDGTNTWVYVVAGYQDYVNNYRRCWLWRYNATANTSTNAYLGFTGDIASNSFYNPRITSDNSNYSSNAYVMIICSQDSLHSGTQHWLKQKYAVLLTPFAAALALTYRNPNISNPGWFYNSTTNPAGKYLASDIAYYRSSTAANRTMTTFQVDYGSPANPPAFNIVTAWSDDYGTSQTGNFQIAEANASAHARLAFTGGTSAHGIVVYQRQFSGTDWDPYFRFTTDNGNTWSTGGYVDASGNQQRGVVSVYAPLTTNAFRVGYEQSNPTTASAFVAKYNSTTHTFPGADLYIVSTVVADTTFGVIQPGIRNGGGDDCLAIWRGLSNAYTYCSYLCAGTVGITHENETPVNYSLSQNYPNPFNPTTNIKFSILNSGNVNITVFDITGKEVATLVDQNFNVGSYTVDFDASSLSSGIYFYTIKAGSFTDTKKMMLVK